MREHLFRGFETKFVPLRGAEALTITGKELRGAWVEGNLQTVYKIDGTTHVAIADCEVPGGYIEVIPDTVAEYTGQKDKNGKKIFEHHICRFFCDDGSGSMDYVVRWNGEKSGFVTESVEKLFDEVEELDDFFAERCEVVGDVFDTRVLEYD